MLKFLTGSAAEMYAERKARDTAFLTRLENELEDRVDKWLASSNTSDDRATIISQLQKFIAFIRNGSSETTEKEESEMAHIQAQFKDIIYGKDAAFLQGTTRDCVHEVLAPDAMIPLRKQSSSHHHHAN